MPPWPPEDPLIYFASEAFREGVERLCDEMERRFSGFGDAAVFDSVSRAMMKVVGEEVPPEQRLNLRNFESEKALFAFVRKAAIRRALKARKRGMLGEIKRTDIEQLEDIPDSGQGGPAEVVERAETDALNMRKIESVLSKREIQIFHLHYSRGLKLSEVANQMAWSEQYVSKTMSLALAKIQKHFGQL